MKSVLIIGLGRFGRHLSRKFIEEGNAVLAIEKDEERAGLQRVRRRPHHGVLQARV